MSYWTLSYKEHIAQVALYYQIKNAAIFKGRIYMKKNKNNIDTHKWCFPSRKIIQKPIDFSTMDHDSCGIGAVINIDGHKDHKVLDDALSIVENLEHRSGLDASGKVGDGVGILTQISHRFFKKATIKDKIALRQERDYGIGMFFFTGSELEVTLAKRMFEVIAEKYGIRFLGWRNVPVHPEILGGMAFDSMPQIIQAFLERPQSCPRGFEFDKRLYVLRREFEQCAKEGTYICSLSSRTIVYKGMFLVDQLRKFYDDLNDPDYLSAIALVHSRFSTNTSPSWIRAHPYRTLVHNGEINTIRGNVDKMLAREETMQSPLMKKYGDIILPVINYVNSPVPIEEVEPASDIVKRFNVSAMSFGAISREAHECLAVAANPNML